MCKVEEYVRVWSLGYKEDFSTNLSINLQAINPEKKAEIKPKIK